MRLNSKIVPSNMIAGGKKSVSDGGWNPPPPSAARSVVVVSVLRMLSQVGDGLVPAESQINDVARQSEPHDDPQWNPEGHAGHFVHRETDQPIEDRTGDHGCQSRPDDRLSLPSRRVRPAGLVRAIGVLRPLCHDAIRQ